MCVLGSLLWPLLPMEQVQYKFHQRGVGYVKLSEGARAGDV